MEQFDLVSQEDSMGCGIACVSSFLGMDYSSTKKLFSNDFSATRGYYLKELAEILKKEGFIFKYGKFNDKTKEYLNRSGTIIFLKRSEKFPFGHYLLRTPRGWMNPWINYPEINPAKAGYEEKLPGEAQWILYFAKR